MFTDSNSPLSQLFQLRQELGIPINAIISYSEMIIEEIAEINQDVTYLPELEQIRACGAELLASVNIFFDPTRLTKDWQDLQSIISNPQLQTQLAKPTQVVIDCSQQLISLVDKHFVLEVRQINRAANQLYILVPMFWQTDFL
jgi:hypothetical protein